MQFLTPISQFQLPGYVQNVHFPAQHIVDETDSAVSGLDSALAEFMQEVWGAMANNSSIDINAEDIEQQILSLFPDEISDITHFYLTSGTPVISARGEPDNFIEEVMVVRIYSTDAQQLEYHFFSAAEPH